MLLVLAILIAYLDRQILSLLVAPIKTAFALSDTRVGALQGVALNLCYGAAALPLGAAVDRHNRVWLIIGSVVVWTLFTALSGLCEDYNQLFVCRMGVGIAEAGLVPAAYSLIADLFAPACRTSASFIFYAATLVGASAALFLSGAGLRLIVRLAPHLPRSLAALPLWRLTFFAAALPAAALGLLFLTVAEPTRKGSVDESLTPTERSSMPRFLRDHGVMVACLLGGLVAAGVGVDALLTWAPTILARSFGWSPARAGEWLGFSVGVGSVAGVLLAGILSRLWQGRLGVLAPLQVLEVGALTSAFSAALFWFAPTAPAFFWVASIHLLCAFVALSTGPALLVAVVPNHMRGRTLAMYVLTTMIVGAASSMLIGVLSDHIYGGASGLYRAFRTVITPTCFAAPALLMVIAEPFRRARQIPSTRGPP